MNECFRVEGFDPEAVGQPVNQWIIGATARAVAQTTQAIEDMKFNEAANAAYDFVWGTFCDWYLELAKPVMTGEDAVLKAETQATAAFILDEILKLLHPFMPFVTEELWAETGKTGPARETLLIHADWPALDGLAKPAADAEMEWLIAVISGIRSVRAEMNVPAGAKIALEIVGADDVTRSRTATHQTAIERLARISGVAFCRQGAGQCRPARHRRGDLCPAARRRHRPSTPRWRACARKSTSSTAKSARSTRSSATSSSSPRRPEEVIEEQKQRQGRGPCPPRTDQGSIVQPDGVGANGERRRDRA